MIFITLFFFFCTSFTSFGQIFMEFFFYENSFVCALCVRQLLVCITQCIFLYKHGSIYAIILHLNNFIFRRFGVFFFYSRERSFNVGTWSVYCILFEYSYLHKIKVESPMLVDDWLDFLVNGYELLFICW